MVRHTWDVPANLARLLLDAVAPRRCAGCDAVCAEPICPACLRAMGAMAVPPIRRLPHGRAAAAFEFVEPVRSALHRGKFGGDRRALEVLGSLTSTRIAPSSPVLPDAVVAVPLGPRRRRQRGYNQAEVLAGAIAAAHRIPVLDGLTRIRDTPPQSSRDEIRRRTNVAGAFVWEGNPLGDARLWLIDDVLTTGATIDAAGVALAAAGAGRVDAVTVAVVP